MYKYWQQIDKVINKTLVLEPQKRRSFLEKTFNGEPDILEEAIDYLSFIERAETEQFLESDLMSQSFLADEISSIVNRQETIKHIIGKQIGPYVIRRLIGEGGMGAVYLAERAEGGFEQKVAIKFMRGGFYSLYLRERFNSEKQILSKLNHLNVARLLDGGITDEGSPYFIMEYVDGKPVDVYCRKNNLNLHERLTLFLQICRAVQYAHSKLIIHRDLKPENIYIAPDSEVKVMDFGIAKLLTPDVDDELAVRTREGQIIASFEFAAPEQVGAGLPSVETDVYGLGALLYLLCTEEHPFQFKNQSISEIETVICSEPPPNPRNHCKDRIGAISKDLEAIILKTLRKEPERRYESVLSLREDIERYQKGFPVQARKGTLRYKTVKFLKRNKSVITTAAIFFVIIVSFTAYHIHELTREKSISQAEAEKARAVTGYLTDRKKQASPYNQSNSEITAREILDLGIGFIQNEVIDQPEIRSSLLATVGGIYQVLGTLDKSETLLFEALELEKSFNDDGQDDGYGLGVVHRNLGDLKTSQGDYSAAIDHYNTATKIFDQLDLPDLKAGSILGRGWSEYRLANYEQADSLYQLALSLNRKLHGENSIQTAKNFQYIAWLQHDYGNYLQSDSLFTHILTIRRDHYNDDHPDIATTLHSLGWIKYQLREYEEAASLYEEAIAIRKKLFDDNPHADLAWSINNLGLVRQAQRNYDEGEILFSAALQMRQDVLPADHPHISQSLGNLGSIYFYKENYDEAISTFRKVVDIQRDILGTDHPDLAMYINNLATVLSKAGRPDQSISYYEEAIDIQKTHFSRSHPSTLQIGSNLADAYEKLKRYSEAEIVRIKNFEALRKEFGIDDPQTQRHLEHLIHLFDEWGRAEKQEKYRRLLAGISEN